MRMLARACALALCLMLALSPALAERCTWRLTVDLHPENWPEEAQQAVTALDGLCNWLYPNGVLRTDDGAFMLEGGSPGGFDFRVQGVPSHWQVETSLTGDVLLLLNNLALLEFGLKAEDYLGIPLQRAFLLVPYAHTSAWAVLAEAAAPLLPDTDGERRLSGDELLAIADELTRLAAEDRTVRCYLESIGADRALFRALACEFPDGLTVRRSGSTLTWESAASTPMTFTRTENSVRLVLAAASLNAEIALSHTGDALSAGITAQSPLLSGDVHLRLTGTYAQERWQIHLYSDSAEPLLSASLYVHALPEDDWRFLSAEELHGVNVLSLNGDTLPALMHQIAPTLISGGLHSLSECPAETVQALMDLLDESGVIALLSDALLHAQTEY